MIPQKGFSLTELIVVLVIVGMLSAIAIPSYIGNVQTGHAKAACNNLSVIANAEKNYYLSTGQYCTGSNGSTCGDSYADLNKNLNLNLNISDSIFSYACSLSAPTIFLCTATINPGNTLVSIPLPSHSFQMMSSGGSNIGIQISGGCVPTVPCSEANNCSTDSCGISCGTCSGASQCSSNTAGAPGQCACPNTCPATGSCGNDACGHLCGNCQVPPNTCNIAPGNTVGTCVTAGAVCAPGTCGIKDANGNSCTCPDSTYSCNASHQCYQCPDLPANTAACPNNLNQASTVYTVVPNCNTPGVCQAVCPVDPSGKNGPGFYNIVGGTECVINPVCGTLTTAISCAQGMPQNEWADTNYNTYWDCVSGSVTVHCPAPPPDGPGVVPPTIQGIDNSYSPAVTYFTSLPRVCAQGTCPADPSVYTYALAPSSAGGSIKSGVWSHDYCDNAKYQPNPAMSETINMAPYTNCAFGSVNPGTVATNGDPTQGNPLGYACLGGTRMTDTQDFCAWEAFPDGFPSTHDHGDSGFHANCKMTTSYTPNSTTPNGVTITGQCKKVSWNLGPGTDCNSFFITIYSTCSVWPIEACVPGNQSATCSSS